MKLIKYSLVTFATLLVSTFPSQSEESVKWIKPVQGTIPNHFGNSYEFYDVFRAGHTGVDIATHVGSNVHVVADGIIRFIKTKPNMRYGNYIVVEHENGLYTLYAHLQKVLVTIDEKVTQGTVIARSGISGLASYPHVHFEVLNKVPVRDGAWGYNYICERRSESVLNKERLMRDTHEGLPVYDFMPLHEILEKFSFMNTEKKTMSHFYRMKDNICVEKPINEITYYNPENFLPKYEHSIMPEFRGRI